MLFKKQLQKDFEGAGLSRLPGNDLPSRFDLLKAEVMALIAPLRNSSQLPGLLYRIDISEIQLKKYGAEHPGLDFEEVLAELIIKRELQKVILKKRFSNPEQQWGDETPL